MKIGIMTWYFGANYGAKAQAYALQQVIKNMGHECVMVAYKPSIYKRLNVWTNLPTKRHNVIQILQSLVRCWRFERTNAKYHESKKVRNASEIDDLQLDCIVFGSDAIFNLRHPLADKLYYGATIKTPKITYSPSCEYLSPNTVLDNECKQSLLEMSALSVRDINTQILVKHNTGKEPIITLDPTLLYSFDDIEANMPVENYILVYTFSDWDEYSEQVQAYAKRIGAKIVAIGRHCSWADKSYSAASFEQWVTAFRKAKLVLTDSFHGTVFSIKNHKELVLCCRSDKRAKIESLIRDAGIQREFYDGKISIEEYLYDSIDYEEVSKRMDKLVDESMRYLIDSLNIVL